MEDSAVWTRNLEYITNSLRIETDPSGTSSVVYTEVNQSVFCFRYFDPDTRKLIMLHLNVSKGSKREQGIFCGKCEG